MKIQEARALNDEELSTELDRLRRHLFDLRAQRVTEKLEDPALVTKSRRDIARVLMVMRERELAAVRQGEASEA